MFHLRLTKLAQITVFSRRKGAILLASRGLYDVTGVGPRHTSGRPLNPPLPQHYYDIISV